MKPFLSLVIPAYNEEARIGNSLKLAVAYMNQTMYKYEILIVDDGSKDNTIKVASEFENVKVIAQPQNMGKGAAVKAVCLPPKVIFAFSQMPIFLPRFTKWKR